MSNFNKLTVLFNKVKYFYKIRTIIAKLKKLKANVKDSLRDQESDNMFETIKML